MQNKYFYLLLFLSSIILFTGCRSDESHEEVVSLKAQYSIRYLESEHQLRGQVSFSKNDSIEHNSGLVLPDKVYFNGSMMKKRALPNGITRYESTLKGPISHPITMGLSFPQNEDIKEIKYDMTAVGDFSILSASKTNGLRVQLSSGITEDESILFLFTDPNQEARTIIRPGPINDLEVFIPADGLLHFIPGSYRAYIVKSKKTKEIQEGVDIQTLIEYYSKEQGFELIP